MTYSSGTEEPIAIIGLACRFPGQVKNPDDFWKLLIEGRDAITEIPPDRWSINEFYSPRMGVPGTSHSRWGGFIEGLDRFEPEFFGLSPREAHHIDPQHRLLLEAAWEALEDAGVPPKGLAGSKTGVYIGISTMDYSHIQYRPEELFRVEAYAATSAVFSLAANRISYCFDLRGPSIAIDTACSSSLMAVHLACRDLWQGDSRLALAGGVNLILIPDSFVIFSLMNMLSPDGRSKTFDARANGFVRGEGVGLVVLKRLSAALTDGDSIYAVIQATGTNQDGRTSGITVPNHQAQEELLIDIYRQAGINPAEVHYVEAHGTGTPVGDPIEARAIGQAFSRGRPIDQPLLIGSVKTNIGHLEAAAGIAGLIKTALMLKHRMIPPNLHFQTPNPEIDFEGLRLKVPTTLMPWPDQASLPKAGINSFGFGGANAHLVLTAAPDRQLSASLPSFEPPYLLPLSAFKSVSLEDLARSYLDRPAAADNQDQAGLSDLCYSAGLGRSHLDHRAAFVLNDWASLKQELEAFLVSIPSKRRQVGRVIHGRPLKLVFIYSGQGPQWWAMGRELLRSEPVFREIIAQCDQVTRQLGQWSLMDELSADQEYSRLQETAITQPAIFALQAALTALFDSWGIKPDLVIGHSVGEVAAAWAAGAFSLDEAARIIFHRGRAMDHAFAHGLMLAIEATLTEAVSLIAGREDRVSIGAINSPRAITLSGDPDVLAEIATLLEDRDIFARFLKVDYAFHSPRMAPMKEDLLASLADLKPRETTYPMISTVTGRVISGLDLTREYWWQNVRQTVRFSEGLETILDLGGNIFLEISPHPVLGQSVRQVLDQRGADGTILSSLRRQDDEKAQLLQAVGGLYVRGYPVDWAKIQAKGRRISLPTYPWLRDRYWNESKELRDLRLRSRPHPFLKPNYRLAAPAFEMHLDARRWPFLRDHRVQGQIVFPASAYLEMAWGLARETFGEGAYTLEDLDLISAVFLSESGAPRTLQIVFQEEDSRFEILSREMDAEKWTSHAVGHLRMTPQPDRSVDLNPEEVKARSRGEVPAEDFYLWLKRIGLDYGPHFMNIHRLWIGENEALGLVNRLENHDEWAHDFLFHPAGLDACFQVLAGAGLLGQGAEGRGIFLPVQIDKVTFYGRPSGPLWSHARLRRLSSRQFTGDVWVYDEAGRPVLTALGFKGRLLTEAGPIDQDRSGEYICRLKWQCLFDQAAGHDHRRPALNSPSLEAIPAKLSQLEERYVTAGAWRERAPETEERINLLAASYFLSALAVLGLKLEPGTVFCTDFLFDDLHLSSRHRRAVETCLVWLEKLGFLEMDQGGRRLTSKCRLAPPEAIWSSILKKFPVTFPELLLLSRFGQELPRLLTGELDPLEVLFPSGSTELLEYLYRDSSSAHFYHTLAAAAITEIIAGRPSGYPWRVLEIGAGTGGLTAHILPVFPAESTQYLFTDVSNLFFLKAEQSLKEFPFVKFQTLDLELDPMTQGFTPRSFDLILLAEVIHATSDLRQSLGHIQHLLKEDGILLMIEISKPTLWVDLSFGLTEGWWKFTDHDLRPAHPILPVEIWPELLAREGFSQICRLPATIDVKLCGQAIFLARGPGRPEPTPDPSPKVAIPLDQNATGLWLIFADDGGLAIETKTLLEERGGTCALVYPGRNYRRSSHDRFEVPADQPKLMEQLFNDFFRTDPNCRRGILHFWSLDGPPVEQLSLADLERVEKVAGLSLIGIVQSLAGFDSDYQPRLIIVTQGAAPAGHLSRPISVEQTIISGLAPVIMNEYPRLDSRWLDLDPDDPQGSLYQLVAEILSERSEEEMAFRHGTRFIPRVERLDLTKVIEKIDLSPEADRPTFRLDVPTSGRLDHLRWLKTDRLEPGPKEIVIRVESAALNFQDVMKVLGLYPTDGDDYLWIGDECAGRIERVGQDVTAFQPGDEVVAVTMKSLRSHALANEDFTFKKPDHLTFDEAVTIPIAFLTAHHCLKQVGRIKAGERVLIQAAGGGVGLAALEVAQRAGAQVFATASSPKQELLRKLGAHWVGDSRTLDFADQIMAVTQGRGVDLVLNSLGGAAIDKGLSILGNFGRFIELGKRDIYANHRIHLRPFKRNLQYSSIDLALLVEEEPEVVVDILKEIFEDIASRRYHPLPYRSFPLSRTVEAFSYMAKAKHVGKVVISFAGSPIEIESRRTNTADFQEAATYLITGGLGGVGLLAARWMVDNGARRLVLLGRHGPATTEARQAIDHLRAKGAKIVIFQGDVSKEEDLAACLAMIETDLPPLKGVIHGAMVLDDCFLTELTPERLHKVIAPKVWGAWNLHRLTLDQDLDFFLLFSSGTSIFGNPGQANYSAANTFLDTLAHYRRGLGLKGTSINWGFFLEIGYVAQRPEVINFLEKLGQRGFSPDRALEILSQVMSADSPQVGVLKFNWSQIANPRSTEKPLSRLRNLFGERTVENTPLTTGLTMKKLESAEPGHRKSILIEYLSNQVAAVLGTDASKLDPEQSLNAIGLDSLMAVELKNRVESELGPMISWVEMRKGPSLTQLCDLILDQYARWHPVADQPAPTGPPADTLAVAK